MNALIGADRDLARGRYPRHPCNVIGMHRLLEEIEARIGERAHVLHRLVRVPSLIGVGRNQTAWTDELANPARALGVDRGLIDADLDLVGAVALLALGL